MENQQELAFRCAFDPVLHQKNGTRPCWDAVDFTVTGELPALSPGGQVDIILRCEVPFPIRILAVLAQKMSCSTETLRQAAAQGLLRDAEANQDITRRRLKSGVRLLLAAASPAERSAPCEQS